MLAGTKPKFAIAITMYNETELHFKYTMMGVVQNYYALYHDPDVKMRQKDLVVYLVCDGYEAMPSSFKSYAQKVGFLDENLLLDTGYMVEDEVGKRRMKTLEELMENGAPPPNNVYHWFQASISDFGLGSFGGVELNKLPINFVFCLKQRNDGKVNSHRSTFLALSKYLRPELLQLIDIGTAPDAYSLHKIYKYMEANPQCGGSCGEIEVIMPNNHIPNSPVPDDIPWSQYLFTCAQFYEYKKWTPLKIIESFFGFQLVLPGAYCTFRYEAIEEGPMDAFFKIVDTRMPPINLANEYLAEDRLMILYIIVQEGKNYHCSFVPDAKAYTDPPPQLKTLVKQRRRWLNGGFFSNIRIARFTPALIDFTGKRAGHINVLWTLGMMITLWIKNVALCLAFVYPSVGIF